MLRLHLRTAGHSVVVNAAGEIQAGGSDTQLQSCVGHALVFPPRVVILDLSGVTAMDAAGIGALLRVRADCEEAGAKLVLLRPTPRIRRLLALCRLTDVIEVTDADSTEHHAAGPTGQRPIRRSLWPSRRLAVGAAPPR